MIKATLDGILAEIVRNLPRVPHRYTLHCAPDVFASIREAAMNTYFDPMSLKPEIMGQTPPIYGTADIIVRTEFDQGVWEIREDDVVIDYGRFRNERS